MISHCTDKDVKRTAFEQLQCKLPGGERRFQHRVKKSKSSCSISRKLVEQEQSDEDIMIQEESVLPKVDNEAIKTFNNQILGQ